MFIYKKTTPYRTVIIVIPDEDEFYFDLGLSIWGYGCDDGKVISWRQITIIADSNISQPSNAPRMIEPLIKFYSEELTPTWTLIQEAHCDDLLTLISTSWQ